MFRVQWLALSTAILICSWGCKEPDKAASNTPETAAAASDAGGGSGGIAPIGGVGAGPMTPISGAESVQGGGSAAGSVLKERAKGLAAQSPSSLNQAGGEEGP